MYRKEIVFFFSHHKKFSRFIGFLIPTILKYCFCSEVVLVTVRKVLLLSSLSENFTLYFINLDFDISSSGSITHLPFKQSISKILFRSNANIQMKTCDLTLTSSQCLTGLISTKFLRSSKSISTSFKFL